MRTAALLLLLAPAAPALAQSVTLTEEDGRPLLVGESEGMAEGLSPGAFAADEVVAEFRRICLPDPATAAGRVEASPLQLASDDAIFPPVGKAGEARVARWAGQSAILSVWAGEDAGLRGRPIAITSRGYSTTGPYGPFRAEGVQCNLVMSVADFASAAAVTEALKAAFGTPAKLVVKKSFADGFWQSSESGSPIRINFTAPSVRGGPQPIHLSAQVISKGK